VLKFCLVSFALCASLMPAAYAAPEDQTLEDVKPELPFFDSYAWTFNIDDEARLATHDLTGFACPFNLDGDYNLSEIVQYNISGTDLGCNYVRKDRGGYITYYISWFSNPATAQAQAEATIDTLKSVRSLGKRLGDTGQIGSGIEGYAGNCHLIEYEVTGQDTPTVTGARLCVSDKWVFKTRITKPISEEDPARAGHFTAADTSFGKFQNALVTHQTRCNTAQPPETEAGILSKEDSDTVALALGLLGTSLQTGAEAEAESGAESISNYCTIFDASSEDAGFLFMQNPASVRKPYALYKSDSFQRSKTPLLWLESHDVVAELLKEAGSDVTGTKDLKYALWAATSDTRRVLYRVYDAQPTREQFIRDGADAINGKLEALVGISIDEDGNSNIELTISDEE